MAKQHSDPFGTGHRPDDVRRRKPAAKAKTQPWKPHGTFRDPKVIETIGRAARMRRRP